MCNILHDSFQLILRGIFFVDFEAISSYFYTLVKNLSLKKLQETYIRPCVSCLIVVTFLLTFFCFCQLIFFQALKQDFRTLLLQKSEISRLNKIQETLSIEDDPYTLPCVGRLIVITFLLTFSCSCRSIFSQDFLDICVRVI